jgi:FixJ family two-component response regulator
MDSPWVAIVDDDVAVAQSLQHMLRHAGMASRSFTSTRELLKHPETGGPACAVAKLLVADMSGLELQRQLASRQSSVPVIFIVACDDIAATVSVMKAGAVSCLRSPVREPDLIAAVREAISRGAALRAERDARREVSQLIGTLTAREREVLTLVVAGLANKQIAFQLGTAEKTVKVHRWRLMRKLRARTSIDLVRRLAAVGVSPVAPPRERDGAPLNGTRGHASA